MASHQGGSQILLGSRTFTLGRRRRRGAALLVTVLIAVAAATIALVLVRQGLDIARSDATRGANRTAVTTAEDVRTTFENQLAANPTFFLSTVAPYERARVCLTREDLPVVEPGQPWPSDCGSRWDYTTPETPGSSFVEITAPTPDNALLHVDVAASVGSVTAGVSSDYLVGPRARPLVTSAGDLSLSDLGAGDGVTRLSGMVYSNGVLAASSTPSVVLEDPTLTAERGFSPLLPAGTSGASAVGQGSDIRPLVPSPITPSGLRATVSRLVGVGCSSPSATLLPDGYATSLCLDAGRTMVNTAGEEVLVPRSPAWLLLPSAGGEGTVDVYYPNAAPSFTSGCDASCDLLERAGAETAAATHPGSMNYWARFLGTFPLPASGVVATDADTYLSICGDAFLIPGAPCVQTSGPGPGVQVDRSFTVVAGSVEVPADVYVSGPVATTATASLGVVASGDLVFPYWSRSSGSDLNVSASLLALGRGPQDSVRTLTAPSPAPFSVEDRGGVLRLSGSLSATVLSPGTEGFRGFEFRPDVNLLTRPAPYLSGGSLLWERSSDERLTPERLSALLTDADRES